MGLELALAIVPMVMHPWMTGMCKQSTLNGAFRWCQAQWSPLLNAREKGHSSPNCSTKPELPGLYLAWLASMTQTGKAAMEVKQSIKKNEAQRKATTCTRQKKKRRLAWNHFCDKKGSNPLRFPMELFSSWMKGPTAGRCSSAVNAAWY